MTSNRPRRFAGDQAGNVAIIFALGLLPITVCAGAAIDFRMAQNLTAAMQSASDTAIVSVMSSRYLTDEQRAQRAKDLYRSNLAKATLSANVTPDVSVANGLGTISSRFDMPTSVLRVIGISTLPVKAKSTARSFARRIEMSLMTDITGSMADPVSGSTKIAGLKLAARDLLEIILPDDMPAGSARVALVPFANYVNAGTYASAATGLAPTRVNAGKVLDLITCVTERTGKDAYTDAAPGPLAYIGASANGNTANNYNSTGGCMRSGSGSSSALPAVMALTDDRASLLATIDGYTPSGSTAGHLGTAWAWYALSPNWNNVWSLGSPIASYSDSSAMKVAVLMTDGEYNTQYASAGSKAQALALCNGMKAAGITVYTVGFGLDAHNSSDAAAIDTLSKCASGKETFFIAYDGQALRDVFTTIGGKVANLNAVLTE